MSENLAARVARIIAGGAHALLDKAESLAPEHLMSQSIREVDQVIGEVRGDIGKAEAAKHLVLTQITRLNSEHDNLAERIGVAVSNRRDDLAKAAIGRQADIEDLLPVLQRSLDEQSDRSREFESYLIALLAKKRELEELLVDFRENASAHVGTNSAGQGADRQARVDGATSSFNRVFSRKIGTTGLVGGASVDAASLKELVDLQRENRISERLAEIKASREGL